MKRHAGNERMEDYWRAEADWWRRWAIALLLAAVWAALT